MSKHAERSLARKQALQVLYQSEMTGTDIDEIIQSAIYITDDQALAAYARTLLGEMVPHLEELDAMISRYSDNWKIDRMPSTDRNILRIALYELCHTDTPTSVAIDEAVELAKVFGGEDESSRFVNGILGRFYKERLKEEGTHE